MPLKVSDGIGAWVKDFKKSDAPQFKGKDADERRDMAIAAYLSAKRGGKPQSTANESVIYEESDKSTDRLKMLVRLGLMDKKDMTKIVRSIGKMKEDKPVSPADRKILFDLLNELIGMVTGDEQIFQKAKKAVREEKDPNEYDKEGEMMKNQLRQICSANEKLMKMVGDDDNLPEWVQNKVTKATDYIRSVRDYLEAENGDDDEKEMDEAKIDEISTDKLNKYYDAAKKSKDRATNSAVATILRKGDHSKDLNTMRKREKGIKLAKSRAVYNLRKNLK